MSGALDESVTLEEIVAIVSSKRVPLAPELAGYLVLEVCEQCKDDSTIDANAIYVSEEGSVAVVHGRRGGDEGASPSKANAEISIRALLGTLIEASGSQTPALAAVSRKKSGGGVASLSEDLEAALIPVNRAAGRRALARLAREVKRVVLGVGRNASVPVSERGSRTSSASLKPEPPVEVPPPQSLRPASPSVPSERPASASSFDVEEVHTTARREIPAQILADAASERVANTARKDAFPQDLKRDSVDSLLDTFEVSEKRGDKDLSRDLKAIAGLDPTPPPPGAAEIDRLLSGGSVPLGAPTTQPAAERARLISYADDRQLPTAPSQLKRLSFTNEVKKKGNDRILILAGLFVLMIAAVAIWLVKPGFLTGRTPEKIQQEREAAERERQRIATLQAIPQCRTSLIVDGAPDDSEILLRVGQAPADIDKMPVGVRLEFVATADGYAPKRAVIPLAAPWENVAGKSRFELAVQLDKSKMRGPQADPWPPGEPGSEVGGKGNGPPGVVHLVSTPKGAEVWLLAGLGPHAVVEDLAACDTDVDILVAGPKTYRKRLHVSGAQFQADPAKAGWRVAKVAVPPKG